MRLLIIAFAVLPIGAATAETVPTIETAARADTAAQAGEAAKRPIRFVELDPKKNCPTPLVHELEPGETPGPKKLTELPPADAFHAVYRLDEDGCLDPVMVGYQHRNER